MVGFQQWRPMAANENFTMAKKKPSLHHLFNQFHQETLSHQQPPMAPNR
jgi:hypothetical protein